MVRGWPPHYKHPGGRHNPKNKAAYKKGLYKLRQHELRVYGKEACEKMKQARFRKSEEKQAKHRAGKLLRAETLLRRAAPGASAAPRVAPAAPPAAFPAAPRVPPAPPTEPVSSDADSDTDDQDDEDLAFLFEAMELFELQEQQEAQQAQQARKEQAPCLALSRQQVKPPQPHQTSHNAHPVHLSHHKQLLLLQVGSSQPHPHNPMQRDQLQQVKQPLKHQSSATVAVPPPRTDSLQPASEAACWRRAGWQNT